MGEREAERSWRETERMREGKGRSENEDVREQEGNDEGGGEERAPLAWRTMGFSCILLIFPKVRGGSLAVCSARA